MNTEKRLLLAVILMMAVVFSVNILFPPAEPSRPAGPVDTVTVTGPEGALPEDTAWVETPLYRLAFASRGGRLVRAEMLQFESLAPNTRGEPVQLVPPGSENFLSHMWVVGDDTLDLRGAQFDIMPPRVSLPEGSPPQELTLTYQHPRAPFGFDLTYSFKPDSYVVEMRGRLRNVPATGWWALGLGPGLVSNEAEPEEDYDSNLAFGAHGPAGTESEKIVDIAAGERRILDGPFDWAGVRTKYFVAAIVRPTDTPETARLAGLRIEGLPPEFRAQGITSFPVQSDGTFRYRFYVGPQDYGRLSAIGFELEEINPVGYRWLQPVLRPLVGGIIALLIWMHNFLQLPYGWILIIFGVGIRVVLFPLYQKSMRSQMATMRVQPLMKEIQTKHKNDPQKLQQEMLKLYKEHKINPLGGCLPMLLPFPILIALFFVFRDTIEFRGVPFLWLPDLSRADPLYIIPVVMGLSVFLLQWISQRSMPQSNPQMKMMMWIMPVMLTVLFLNFASGLNLYYATMNIASLPQQLYLAKERKAAGVQPPTKT